MQQDASEFGVFFDGGAAEAGTDCKISPGSGRRKEKRRSKREVCSYRQVGRADGLSAKWTGARVFRFSSGALEKEGARLWPAGARSTVIVFSIRVGHSES